MNPDLPPTDEQLSALFAELRPHPSHIARSEYGFETRLLARLKESPREASIWSLAAWRMAPFFALMVVGLAWLTFQVEGSAQDSEQVAYMQNPEVADLISNFN